MPLLSKNSLLSPSRSKTTATFLLLMLLGNYLIAPKSLFAESSEMTAQRTETSNEQISDIFSLELSEVLEIEVPSVYAASRYDQLSTRAPGSVTIVTAEEIKLYGWRNIGEVLNSVKGLHTHNDGTFQTVKVRGLGRGDDFSNNGILITLDGIRMNEGLLGSATTSNDFPVDIDMIERIEIVRGSGSALYGSNAFFAVINVITRKIHEIDGVEVSASAGSYDEYKERVSYGVDLGNDWKLGVSATKFDRQGPNNLYFSEFDSEDTNFGVSQNQSGNNYGMAEFQLEHDKFRLQGFFTKSKKVFPESPFESVFANGSNNRHERQIIQAHYNDKLSEDWDYELKTSYNRFKEIGSYQADYSETEDELIIVDNADILHSQSVVGEASASTVISDASKLTFGTEWTRHFQQDLENRDVAVLVGPEDYELGDYLNKKATSSDIGIFSQIELALSDSVLLISGLRYSYYDLVEKQDSYDPRLALIYQPNESTSFKAIYGTAFRSPSAYERLYDDGGITVAAPDSLDPERIETAELVAERYFNKVYSANISTFAVKTKDFIVSEPDEERDVLVFENSPDTLTGYGIESEINAKWESGHRFKVSATWQENEEEDSGKMTFNSPRQLLKTHIAVPLHEQQIFSALEALYVSNRITTDQENADDYWLLNANIFSKEILVKDLETSIGVYNVLDRDYSNPGLSWQGSDTIPQEGRTFRIKFAYKF